MSIRTLLVEDHVMFREAVRLMLSDVSEIEVIGEIGDGSQIEEAITRLNPDIVVMDIRIPNLNGIEATQILSEKFPKIRVVALSAFGHKQSVMEMLEAGAVGYVVKSSVGEELVQAIINAAQGKTYLCPDAVATLVQANNLNNPPADNSSSKRRLNRRETEILSLLAEGKNSPQIAKDLYIATSTVDGYRRSIMRKLELHTTAELTKYAIRVGLTDI
ncbi:putative Transcriptional regulatory protein DegU [Gammaproteobacteria bacterium]